jgi:hypothetical protein
MTCRHDAIALVYAALPIFDFAAAVFYSQNAWQGRGGGGGHLEDVWGLRRNFFPHLRFKTSVSFHTR